MNDDIKKAFSFGMNEQLITLMSVLSGYIMYPKKKIILALIIMTFSNSLPDCISYYQNTYYDTKDIKASLEITSIAFISEMLSALAIILPIIFISNTTLSIKVSYFIIIILLFVNLYYLLDYSIFKCIINLEMVFGSENLVILYPKIENLNQL